jgi:hypothetical protein
MFPSLLLALWSHILRNLFPRNFHSRRQIPRAKGLTSNSEDSHRVTAGWKSPKTISEAHLNPIPSNQMSIWTKRWLMPCKYKDRNPWNGPGTHTDGKTMSGSRMGPVRWSGLSASQNVTPIAAICRALSFGLQRYIWGSRQGILRTCNWLRQSLPDPDEEKIAWVVSVKCDQFVRESIT